MAIAGLGRRSELHPWHVVAVFGEGPTGKIHELSIEEATELSHSLQEMVLKAQARNRHVHKVRVINGEGSGLRDDAPTERHLRAV